MKHIALSLALGATLSLGLAASAALGCASSPQPAAPAAAPAAPTAEAAPRLAEPPYSAEQIRAATQPGRTYLWRVARPDAPATLRRVHFATATDEGADLVMEARDADGKPLGAPQLAHATWAELQSHGRFPADALRVTEGSITVPAGTYAAWSYEVTQPDGHVVTFWFAKDLPGAPVCIVERDGAGVVEQRELVAHTVEP